MRLTKITCFCARIGAEKERLHVTRDMVCNAAVRAAVPIKYSQSKAFKDSSARTTVSSPSLYYCRAVQTR